MALATKVNVALNAVMSSALDLVTVNAPLSISTEINMPTGTTSGTADLLWSDTRTVNASSNEDLDLVGVLTAHFGGTLTLVKLKLVYIKAASTNTNNVVLTRPASNGVPLFSAASDAISVLPGGVFLWVAPGAGVTVTASTGDLLNLSNSSSGSSVTYDMVLVGTSA